MRKQQFCLKPLTTGAILIGVLALAGCGSSSNDTATPTAPAAAPITLTGTAAGGRGLFGAPITAKCATGSGTATTAADGTYTLTLTGIAPCMLRVTDPVNAANVYFSAVQVGTTTANITPLTSLIVANALGADPATAYTSFSGSTAANITTSTLSAAVTNVSTALATSLNITIPAGTNPLTATFTAATEVTPGSALDKTIDALVSSLAAGNVPLSTLTTAVASGTTATAVTTAVATAAATSNIATSTLANCPYAPSGQWLVGNIGAQSFKVANLNFKTMTGTSGTNPASPSDNFTITQPLDSSNNPITCAFQLTSTSTTNPFVTAVRVSQSGVAAGGTTPTAVVSPTPVLLSTSDFSMAIPLQSTISLADFAGTWNVAGFGQDMHTALTVPWLNGFGQLVFDSSGTFQEFDCPGALTCPTSASSSGTIAQNTADPSGVFTMTNPVDGTVRKVAAYKSPNGDMIMLMLADANTAKFGFEFDVASKRVSPIISRAVASTYAISYWQITNTSTGLQQQAFIKNFTVNAVTSSPNSFTRTESISNVTDTIIQNDPRPFMHRRPAIAATLTQAVVNEFVGVSGPGWTVLGSTAIGLAPSPTNPVFFGISIIQPN